MTRQTYRVPSDAEQTLRNIEQGRIPANHVMIREAAWGVLAELDAARARLAELAAAAQRLTRSLREEEWVQNGGGTTATRAALGALEAGL